MYKSNFEGTIDVTLSGTVTVNTLAKRGDIVGMYMKGGVNGDVVPFLVAGNIREAKKVASQTWAVGDRLYFDGTDAFTNIPNGTPAVAVATGIAASAAVVGDAALLPRPGAGERVVITSELLAASVDKWIFVADRAYKVVSIREIHSVIGGSGAVVRPRKVTAAGTAAPGDAAGATVKELTTADIGLETTINVAQQATLSATVADLNLAAGDKIGLNFGGTLTGLVGSLSIELVAV
ncbi:MAG TPA: capsid cement protein [Planctomycetota bacterium]|nr:capsid cement protein [Planctomycetota bacterium]